MVTVIYMKLKLLWLASCNLVAPKRFSEVQDLQVIRARISFYHPRIAKLEINLDSQVESDRAERLATQQRIVCHYCQLATDIDSEELQLKIP